MCCTYYSMMELLKKCSLILHKNTDMEYRALQCGIVKICCMGSSIIKAPPIYSVRLQNFHKLVVRKDVTEVNLMPAQFLICLPYLLHHKVMLL